jgi:glycosyltransferase involved in cell wall biosynthesis
MGVSDRPLRILVVSAQFPYPPRFGFAMRVYQLARQLATEHDVTLLSYGGPEDAAQAEHLRGEVEVEVVARESPSRLRKRAVQAASIVSPRPFSFREVHTRAMQAAIDRVCAERRFDAIQLESSVLCAFRYPTDPLLVLDEHNVEYEVFQRMQEGERSAVRRLYHGLEHVRFRRFEQAWWRRVDACVLTSPREEEIVRREAPLTPTEVVPNGVDTERFRPAAGAVQPRTLVFNGLLQYRPNLDAAYWLVDEIWPRIVERCPEARLAIVGRGEAADLARLARPGVEVTGEVPDVRPHLHAAAVVAVPIRMGGGTRLKVVEGLAMGKAMVSTALGCEGIAVRGGEHLLVADAPDAFASQVVELFEDPARAATLGRAGRSLMEDEYSWEIAGTRLRALYDRLTPPPTTGRSRTRSGAA